MEGEKFGKLSEAKECQFGKIKDLMLRNLKTVRRDLENYFPEILFIFSCMEL